MGAYTDSLAPDTKEMLTTVFRKFDAHGNGSVSGAELGNLMRSVGMFPTDDEVEDLLQHMDTDGEGGIELDEFLAHMADQIELRKKVDPEHDFKEAFQVFDKDGNGHVDSDELRRVLVECGRMKLTEEEADEFIGLVDADGDGMLDYSEFVQLFTEKLGLPYGTCAFALLTQQRPLFQPWC